MKLLVFTAGFYDRDYDAKLERLLKTCKKFEIPLEVYGRGQTFSFYDSKIDKLGVFLNNHKNDFTHALYTDASDSFFLRGLKEIIFKYEKMGSPKLLVAAEKQCHPFPELSESFPEPLMHYRFFNPGNFLGEIPYLLEVIGRLKTYNQLKTDDQGHWMKAYVSRAIDLTIDYFCSIFQTMSDCEFDREFRYVGKLLLNTVTGSYPSIVHFNGPKGAGSPNQTLIEGVFNATF